jgi:hypothetical protein
MHRICAVILLAASACGSAGNGSTGIDTAQVVGQWSGSLTEAFSDGSPDAGPPPAIPFSIVVRDLGNGQVALTGVCRDGVSGPTAVMATPTSFSASTATCPAVYPASCPSGVTDQFFSLSGSLANGTLTFESNVVDSGCGGAERIHYSFSGARP